MEGHAGMDMSLHEGSFWQRMTSDQGRAAIIHFFVMDWASLWGDMVAGLLIAGALGAWVPKHFLRRSKDKCMRPRCNNVNRPPQVAAPAPTPVYPSFP